MSDMYLQNNFGDISKQFEQFIDIRILKNKSKILAGQSKHFIVIKCCTQDVSSVTQISRKYLV